MTSDTAIRRGHTITFTIILLFSIVELSIAGWLVSRYNAHRNYRNLANRDRVRYTLFASAWTVVGSIFFLVLFLHSATGSIMTSIASHLVFLVLTWIIWLAAAVSITAMLSGGLDCPTQDKFVYCGQLNTLEAFAWMIFIIVTFMLGVTVIRGVTASRRGDGYRGGLVAG